MTTSDAVIIIGECEMLECKIPVCNVQQPPPPPYSTTTINLQTGIFHSNIANQHNLQHYHQPTIVHLPPNPLPNLRHHSLQALMALVMFYYVGLLAINVWSFAVGLKGYKLYQKYNDINLNITTSNKTIIYENIPSDNLEMLKFSAILLFDSIPHFLVIVLIIYFRMTDSYYKRIDLIATITILTNFIFLIIIATHELTDNDKAIWNLIDTSVITWFEEIKTLLFFVLAFIMYLIYYHYKMKTMV